MGGAKAVLEVPSLEPSQDPRLHTPIPAHQPDD